MTYGFREFYIPDKMMPSIELYIKEGVPPGDFLTAIICNDLKEACGRADNENIRNLPAYAAFFYNNAPADCHGSKEIMKKWINMHKERRENEKNQNINNN
jgi:hypothetical protein